jgi:PadR family transcriptional regulator, regulatory protein PadR
MREPTFWILTSLASEARHGYGVIQEAARLSDGKVRLQAGTLYAALDRLVAEGLIEPDREETVDGRTRRYYRLTDDGAAALNIAAAHLRASAEAAAAQLSSRRRRNLGPATTRTISPLGPGHPGLAV